MAPGCEPVIVRQMMDVMRPHVYGQSMCGAGGGGFMYALAKDEEAAANMERIVRDQVPGLADVRFHRAKLDDHGLLLREEQVVE